MDLGLGIWTDTTRRYYPVERIREHGEALIDEIDGRQLAAPPYALPEGDPQSDRNGSCSGSRGAEFTGDYARVMLDNCQDVRITNARIGYLQVANSRVRVVNSHIRGGIDAKNAHLELTGGSVRSSMVLDAASVDTPGSLKPAVKELIVDGVGGQPGTYRSLASALSDADFEEEVEAVITIKWNGPLPTRSLELGSRTIRIRAAPSQRH